MPAKLDRCVRDVLAENPDYSEERAYRICNAQLSGKTMSKSSRREEKRKRAELRQLRDIQHKAELTATAAAERAAELEREPEAKDADEKCGEEPMAYMPHGGATTLRDALAAMDAERRAMALHHAAELFKNVMNNIMHDEAIADKGNAIAAAARELQTLLTNPAPLMKAQETEDPAQGEFVSAGGVAVNSTVTLTPEPEARADPPTAKESLWQRFTAWLKAQKDRPEAQRAASSFVVLKQADPDYPYRWFGWVSNKWRDRDYAKHPKGEIITEAAHKEFTAYLDAHPEQAPELWTWHTPGTARAHRADWWDYADGFMLRSGPLTKAEGEAFDPDEPVGMSHGFFALERDAANGHILKYRTFEDTELPPDFAANPFTSFDVIRKELAEMGFSPEKRAHLVKRLGEAKVRELETNTAAMAKALEEAGVEWKDAQTKQEDKPANGNGMESCLEKHKKMGHDEATARKMCADEMRDMGKATSTASWVGVPATAAQAPDDEQIKHILAALDADGLKAGLAALKAQSDQVPVLLKQVETLTTQVAELSKSQDEKVAEMIRPRIRPAVDWGFRPSTDEKTKLGDSDADQQLDKAKPTGWVSEAFAGMDGRGA